MKLNDLETFIDIVEAGGLTAAAARRGVTQPALSRLLRELETRLQSQLLRRTGRGMDLTPAGQELLSFARETLERYQQVQQRIAEQSKSLPRKLRMSVPLRVGRLLIPHLYRDFAEAMPETSVQVFEEPANRAQELLGEQQLDTAITYRSTMVAEPGFVPVFRENLYAVSNKSILTAHESSLAMKNLGRMPLLLPSSGTYRDLIENAFRSAGVDMQIARQLETAEGLLAFAAEGEGVAILPMSNVFEEISRGEVKAVKIQSPEISRVIGVQLGPNMTKHASRPLLSAIRKSMRSAKLMAAWQNLHRAK